MSLPQATLVPEYSTPNPTPNPTNTSPAVVSAAAAVGAVSGLLLSGPVFGVALASGAAYAASRDKGPAGNIARTSGVVAISAASKAKTIDAKYDVSGKAKTAATNIGARAKQIDEKHDVVGKTKRASVAVACAAKNMNEKHDLTGKVGRGVTSVTDYIQRRLSKNEGGVNGNDNDNNNDTIFTGQNETVENNGNNNSRVNGVERWD